MSNNIGNSNNSKNNLLLSVQDLAVQFFTDEGVVRAVDGVGFDIPPGRTVALVGESGCGKTVTALSILQLVPQPPGKIVAGRIAFERGDLLDLDEKQMRKIRGNNIAMIFQEPMTSLNPVYTIGDQIVEAIELHQDKRGEPAWAHAADMLHLTGISDPRQRVWDYPHQLSGGMRQRVMIAMALSCDPKLLIADEPTTALDVTIQAQILDLMARLQDQRGMSILLITHDLGVVAQLAHHVVVMYAGKVVESAPADKLFGDPLHPYTVGLFRAVPRLGVKKRRLDAIGGQVPDPLNFPSGCRFCPRCKLGENDKICQTVSPPLEYVQTDHAVACWKAGGYQQVGPDSDGE